MIKELWFRGLSRARLYRRLILIERKLSEPVPEISVRVPVRVSVLAESEINAYLEFRPEQDAAEIRRRLDEKEWCFAVWHEQQIVHVAWAVSGRSVRIHYLSTVIEVAPDEVYIYDIVTAPSFRRLGVASLRSVEMMRYFRDRGYRRLLGVVRPADESAFRQNVGYRRIGVIGYIGLGPWRHRFCREERGVVALGASDGA